MKSIQKNVKLISEKIFFKKKTCLLTLCDHFNTFFTILNENSVDGMYYASLSVNFVAAVLIYPKVDKILRQIAVVFILHCNIFPLETFYLVTPAF